MRRALSLYLPAWRTDLVKRRWRRTSPGPAGTPARGPSGRRGDANARALPAILLSTAVRGQEIVAACCERASAAGVRPDMKLAHARALLPAGGIHVEPTRPERDRAALHGLGVWAIRFTPLVACDLPDGLLLDVTGCARLFGGERRLLAGVARAVRELGFGVRAAIAPTFGCAWAAARFARTKETLVPEGGERRALAPLPVRALGIDAETEEALGEVGIERVEHLTALPRSEIPARFGDELLLRLDQATGNAIETIETIRPRTPVRAERTFGGPTRRHSSIEAAVREVVADLCEKLERRERGLRRLEVSLVRSDLPPTGITISLSRPSRDPGHLWSLLRPRMERLHLGFGVERVEAEARRTEALAYAQGEWRSGKGKGARKGGWRPEASSTSLRETRIRLAELVDTLENRVGTDRVVRAEAVESHLPERAFRRMPAEEGARSAEERAVAPGDRPSVLLPRPEPVEVLSLTPDGPVARVSWRGKSRRVLACRGPERTVPEWWRDDPGARTRDWFKVQAESGAWLWLYREQGTGRWFLMGIWA